MAEKLTFCAWEALIHIPEGSKNFDTLGTVRKGGEAGDIPPGSWDNQEEGQPSCSAARTKNELRHSRALTSRATLEQ